MAYLVSVAVPGKYVNIAIVSSTDEANQLISDLLALNEKMGDPKKPLGSDKFSDKWSRDIFLNYVQKTSYQHLSYLNKYSFNIDYIPSAAE